MKEDSLVVLDRSLAGEKGILGIWGTGSGGNSPEHFVMEVWVKAIAPSLEEKVNQEILSSTQHQLATEGTYCE